MSARGFLLDWGNLYVFVRGELQGPATLPAHIEHLK